LFWPWCAVIIAGALRLVEQSDSALLRGGALQGIHPLVEAISFLGFFVGIPLLATLSLGNEFHHRTLQLLLSQPVSRMEIWSEKLIVTIVAVLSYAGVMLWLGRRALARFQVTGGLAGDDLLMAGPKMMPRAVAEWLRCRSTSPLLNLIRKELRLLRPVWLISLLAVPAWI